MALRAERALLLAWIGLAAITSAQAQMAAGRMANAMIPDFGFLFNA